VKNILRKFDDVLSPDERFRLALAAMARDDEAESTACTTPARATPARVSPTP
jgi:hypothetical protein